MPFKAYEIYKEYEPDKYKTSTEKKVERVLEQAKKEGIKPPSAEEITARNPEGHEITFNLEQIKQHWIDFYNNHDLKEIAEELENTEITLTDEQIQTIQEKAEDKESSFNEFILLPSIELQNQYLARIKEQTEKPIKDLEDKQQYSKEGTYLSDTVKPEFPQNIKNLNRPQNKPYLLFLQNSPEVPNQTLNQTPDQLRKTLKQRNETGLTLSEYLIFQRNYAENHLKENQPHPDTQYWTWLLDSGLASSGVLRSSWAPGGRQVRVYSYASGYCYGSLGCRSSAILEIS